MREVIMALSNMLVYVFVYFVTSGIILVNIDLWLLAPFAIWIGLFSISLIYFIPKIKNASSNQADAWSLMTGRITDTYANIMTIKLFSYQTRELGYAKVAMKDFMQNAQKLLRLITLFESTNRTISMLLILLTGIASIYQWKNGDLSAGEIATALAMALRLNGLMNWIMWEMAGLFENIGVVQDGMKMISIPNEIKDLNNANELKITKGEIIFKNVNFSYDKGNEHIKILHDFNLHIRSGEKIGLIGRSGAGKSTLVSLLLRFYDAQSGLIQIDNQDIKSITQKSLRAQIGMVTQDTSLLHRTVRENIAYGRPEASEAQIIEVAKKAHAWDFIQNLHDKFGNSGLDTKVGERGVKLSGGQRQRIAIARVMLKNAPILLLDEATSALDSEVEHAINTSLEELMQGKTVIAIAHRLSTIAALDRLVVMDAGVIIESGSHKELLEKNGIYAKLWARQSGGFLGEI